MSAARSGYTESRDGVAGAWSAVIDPLFAAYDRPGHPGVTIAVMRNGEVVHRRGYGVAEIEHDIPFRRDTVLRLGSTSKHLCAAGIFLLERDGKVSVSDDIRRFVPELPDLGATLTLDHLMTMTSGLPDWLNLGLFAGLPAPSQSTRAQMLDWLNRLDRLMFPPGATTSYSNTNYALLSLVIERISGMSLAAFMERRIFKPLAMKSARLVPAMGETIANMAKGYVPGGDGRPAAGLMLPEIHGEGAVNASIEDMTQWLLALRTDGGALGKGLLTWLTHPTSLPGGRSSDYCRALTVERRGGVTKISHAGGMPGYLSDFAYFPEIDLGVILLANWMDVGVFDSVDRIAEIVGGAAVPVRRETSGGLRHAAGLYVSAESGRALALVADDTSVTAHHRGEVAPLDADKDGWWRIGKRGDPRRLKPAPGDAPAYLDVEDGGLAVERLTRCGEKLPVERPADFTGRYVCPTLGETHVIAWDGKGLSVGTGSAQRPLLWSRLARRAGDVFTAPIDSEPSETNVTLRFVRDTQGHVASFDYAISRVTDLRFERQP